MITVLELCKLLGISRKYAYQFIREHNIKYIKIGRKFYVSKKSVEDFVKTGDENGSGEIAGKK